MCAVLQGGAVRCWGEGEFGQLGRGDTLSVMHPASLEAAQATDVNVGGPVAQIAIGAHHTCNLLSNGRVRCWGKGNFGQLGYGNRANVGDVRVPAEIGDVSVGGRVIQIAAGLDHTCALLDRGQVRCWGRGDQGQLGYPWRGNVGDRRLPSEVGDVPVL
jgi:alpha-tubulin suppressor-like RCC1 family protein